MEVNLPPSLSSIESSTQVVKSIGTTHVNVTKNQFIWTISNFSYCPQNTGEKLISPPFYAGTTNKSKWQLLLYPNGENNDNNYVALRLYFASDNKSAAAAKCKFSILNAKKAETNVMEFPQVKQFSKTISTFGRSKFAERSFLKNPVNDLLPNDSLTIVCDITVIEDIVNTVETSDSEVFKIPERQLLDDLSDLFESSVFSDVTIFTRGQEFQAHKVILAARSPVFSAMFKHELKEQLLNRVNIIDVNDEVMREMLRFMYTGKTTNLDKMADDLLAVADKYQLKGLKDMSENALCKSLKIENAADRLVNSDLYGAVHLKAQVLDFICEHLKEVMNTLSYKTMHNTHPHLIDEAFQRLLTKKIVSRASAVEVPN